MGGEDGRPPVPGHWGVLGGTGAKQHPRAMQYCDSVTRGPHVPSPTLGWGQGQSHGGGGTRTEPWRGTSAPGVPPCVCIPHQDPPPLSPVSRGITLPLLTHPFTLKPHPIERGPIPGETEACASPHPGPAGGSRDAVPPIPIYPDVTVVPLPSLMIICWQSCRVRLSPSFSSVRAASASIPTRCPGPERKLGGR